MATSIFRLLDLPQELFDNVIRDFCEGETALSLPKYRLVCRKSLYMQDFTTSHELTLPT